MKAAPAIALNAINRSRTLTTEGEMAAGLYELQYLVVAYGCKRAVI
jgi:hypothetical protein